MHIIVNIDRVFLITINNPLQLLILLIFLVTAGMNGIEILVFNKIDTFDEATLDEQLYMQHVYQEIDTMPRFLYGNEK
jgi:ribosome biogenesis GTPase